MDPVDIDALLGDLETETEANDTPHAPQDQLMLNGHSFNGTSAVNENGGKPCIHQSFINIF